MVLPRREAGQFLGLRDLRNSAALLNPVWLCGSSGLRFASAYKAERLEESQTSSDSEELNSFIARYMTQTLDSPCQNVYIFLFKSNFNWRPPQQTKKHHL